VLKGPYAFCHFGFVVTAVCCTVGTKPAEQAGKQLAHGAVNETVCCDVIMRVGVLPVLWTRLVH